MVPLARITVGKQVTPYFTARQAEDHAFGSISGLESQGRGAGPRPGSPHRMSQATTS